MADDEHEANGDSDEAHQDLTNDEAAQKKAARFDNATAGDLEKITDYAEEKELISTDEFKGVSLLSDRLCF